MTENKSCHSVNSTKEVTHRILGSDGNAIRLSFVTMICIFSAVFLLIVSIWPVVLFQGQDGAEFFLGLAGLFALAVLVGGFLFGFFPLISGVMCFAKRTVDGEKPRIISLFEPFTRKNQNRFISFVLLPAVLILRALIVFLPVAGGVVNLWLLYTDISQMSLFMIIADSAFILCLTALVFVFGLYLSSYFFFVPYLVISGKAGFFRAFAISVKMAQTRKAEITKQSLGQMPSVIVSVLSFMTLWVLFAAPRMLVSYFVYCDEVANPKNNE